MKYFITALSFLFLTLSAFGQSFMPLAVQGYNHDVIAEGTSQSSLNKTTMAMDVVVPSNNVIYTKQFAKANSLLAIKLS